MTQQSDKATWSVSPWAGTIEQLCRAADLCAEKVAGELPYPDGYDPERDSFDRDKDRQWHAAEQARRVEIGVVEPGGYQRTLDSVNQLREWPSADIGHIERLDIGIGGGGYGPLSAKIELGRRGLDIRVSGRDRTWTAGLRHELEHILNPRVRLRPRGFIGGPDFGFGVPFVVYLATFIAVAVTLRYATSLSYGLRIGLDFGAALVVTVFAAVIAFGLPWMELLPANADPRYRRWKRRIVAATGALVLAIVAGVIVAVINP